MFHKIDLELYTTFSIFLFLFSFLISGLIRSTRDLPAPHYTFQIKKFSLLLGMEEEKCHSGQFEIYGYQWYCIFWTLLSAVAFFLFRIVKYDHFCFHVQEIGTLPKWEKE